MPVTKETMAGELENNISQHRLCLDLTTGFFNLSKTNLQRLKIGGDT
jgi:hypothetical protein